MIIWSKNIEARMGRHAQETYPYECCGFMLGKETDKGAVIYDIIPASNTHNGEKRRRFLISPKEYMEAEREALKKGLDLIGVYHSHPDHPAIPSEEDRRHALPGFHYPIISVMDGEVRQIRSWSLETERQFIEQKISVNQIKTSF